MNLLTLLVTVSIAYCGIALAFLFLQARSRGKKIFYSAARMNAAPGIRYAFTQGMLPWEKESAAHHLPTYLAGVIYHAGIGISLFFLFCTLLNITLPALLYRTGGWIVMAGLISGFSLLIKRGVFRSLRSISVPDDFLSNILVNLFLVFTFSWILAPQTLPWLYGAAALLFFYIPAGKIRHCMYFFLSRRFLAIDLGRRAVFPPAVGR
ncbi:MAG TPA: hypothetical protein PK014_11405 [Thermoanaerobaculia bacterium]|nr:hypothetical protein [Thermoanaerobaculia bacterium]HUM30737.1 hypothetical protein [Thermoanaerobaculia bacterium]HXK68974.1 hypothetical protein [Thermoanaerobaculia bacterium]